MIYGNLNWLSSAEIVVFGSETFELSFDKVLFHVCGLISKISFSGSGDTITNVPFMYVLLDGRKKKSCCVFSVN